MKSLIFRDGSLFTSDGSKVTEVEDRDNIYMEYGIDEITQNEFNGIGEESLIMNVDSADSEKSTHKKSVKLSGIKTIDLEEKY